MIYASEVPYIMLATSGNEFLLSNDIVRQFFPESTSDCDSWKKISHEYLM